MRVTIAVNVLCNASIAGRKFRKVQAGLSCTLVEAAGNQTRNMAAGGTGADPAATAEERCNVTRNLYLVRIRGPARDDIDDAKNCIIPKQRRTRAAHHFDAIDEIEIEGELGAQKCASVD